MFKKKINNYVIDYFFRKKCFNVIEKFLKYFSKNMFNFFFFCMDYKIHNKILLYNE